MRFAAALLAAALAVPARSPEAALREGNRLFRAGELEAALAAYESGWDGGDPVLAYNLGATLHQLGRLPEALLWYRRADALDGDPWVRDNLRLVRAQLQSARADPQADPPLRASWLLAGLQHRRGVALSGAALAWLALFLFVAPLPPPWRRRTVLPLAVLACLLFAAGTLAGRVGPRAAVLLAECPLSGRASLPAGSEIWLAASHSTAEWRILGRNESLRCPVGAVGLVDP